MLIRFFSEIAYSAHTVHFFNIVKKPCFELCVPYTYCSVIVKLQFFKLNYVEFCTQKILNFRVNMMQAE